MPRPRKLPSRDEVVRLYRSGMTSPEIAREFGLTDHKPVLAQLIRAGETRRRLGPRNSGVCKVDGCDKPVMQIKHAGNGSMYGTRCQEHRLFHYNTLNRNLQRKKKGLTPDQFKEWQINELKPKGWKWITQSKKQLRAIRSLLAHPSALASLSAESKPDATSPD